MHRMMPSNNLIQTTSVLLFLQPDCIILVVSPAIQDLATSDGIKIAQEVDPDGMPCYVMFPITNVCARLSIPGCLFVIC